MDFLFILFYMLLLIVQIKYLVKSVKTKSNMNWIITYSLNISSILSVILVFGYSLLDNYLSWAVFSYLFICFIAFVVYIITLLVSIGLKLLEIKNYKNLNLHREKIHTNVVKKLIIKPLLIILILSISICLLNHGSFIIQEKIEINQYNRIKDEEIKKMVEFINQKYSININTDDCIYYREEDYSRHSDIFGNGKTYNIPYIAVFKFNNEKITVVDRKGFISDNRQLKDLNKIIARYFQEKTGVEFDFVEFRKSYVGTWSGDDNIINKILQTKFNKLITNENISQFMEHILKESDLSITFYIKESNNIETLINDMTQNLQYLRNYSNIEIVKIYGYNYDLIIDNEEIDFPDEHKNYGNSSDDFYDSYKFGCYYIDSKSNNFTFSITMELNRGYTSGIGESINGWKFRILE